MSEWLKSSNIAKVVTDHWVKDLEASVRAYSDEFKLGPWKFAELKAPIVRDVLFRGEPAEIDLLAAMSEVGPLAVELLQVRGGSAPFLEWADQLDDRFWHFVAYHRTTDEAEEAIASVNSLGLESLLSGYMDGCRFCMYDASPLFGRLFEVCGGDLSGIVWSDQL